MGQANDEKCPSSVPEQTTLDRLPTATPETRGKSEELNAKFLQLLFSFGIWKLVLGICFLTGRWAETLRRFRPSGFTLFVGGLEVWYHAQIYWFSCSFRWQAFGVLLLIYWALALCGARATLER